MEISFSKSHYVSWVWFTNVELNGDVRMTEGIISWLRPDALSKEKDKEAQIMIVQLSMMQISHNYESSI